MAIVVEARPLEWAQVEVMGHSRYLGQIEVFSFLGVEMLRVHMPEVTTERVETDRYTARTVIETYPACTVELSAQAIFRVTRGLTEAWVREHLPRCSSRPVGAEVRSVVGPWRPRDWPTPLLGPVEDAVVVDDDLPGWPKHDAVDPAGEE